MEITKRTKGEETLDSLACLRPTLVLDTTWHHKWTKSFLYVRLEPTTRREYLLCLGFAQCLSSHYTNTGAAFLFLAFWVALHSSVALFDDVFGVVPLLPEARKVSRKRRRDISVELDDGLEQSRLGQCERSYDRVVLENFQVNARHVHTTRTGSRRTSFEREEALLAC